MALPPAPQAIMIGASTGGVEALHVILAQFPADCPPVFVVQHMRAGFVAGFVEGLNRACRVQVVVAHEGMVARSGVVHVAPAGGRHLTVLARGGLLCRLAEGPPRAGHRPSVDVLFASGALLPVPPVAALLTGMGRDGAEGMAALHAAGGVTLAQDGATSTVFGMPRAAIERGVVTEVLPLAQIGRALLRHATAPRGRPGEGAA